jgi:hypothetical protein
MRPTGRFISACSSFSNMNSTTAITLDSSLLSNLDNLKDALINQSSDYELLDVIYLRGIVSSINEQLSQVEDSLR